MKRNKLILIIFLISACYIFGSCDAHIIGVTITPMEYDFGFVDSSKTTQLQLINNSSHPISITGAYFTGGDSSKFRITDKFPPFYITPKIPTFMTVEFTPNGFGQMQSTLSITTSFPGTNLFLITFKGRGLDTEILPVQHDFGVVLSNASSTKDFTYTNNTHRNITITSFEITGVDKSHFSVVSGSPGDVPAYGGSKQATVEFAPYTHGPKTAKITVYTSDSVFPEISADITGEGKVILEENFDNTTMCDTTVTIAKWSTEIPGELVPFGSQDDYNPTSNSNLDADSGPYCFTSIDIPQGVEIKVTGSKPLEIYCKGKVVINGSIILDGKDGANAPSGVGGAGGPGGGAGGDYGQKGAGTGGGATGGAGGGGGFAVKGQDSTDRGSGGQSYGTPDLNPIVGGSGGGGGSGTGAGGGGGGGALLIVAGDNIEIGGQISANGGEGGGHFRPQGATTTGGGGGSGGAVKLVSLKDITFTGGTISVLGGMGDDGVSNATRTRSRGGYGSPGIIRLEDQDGLVEGIGGSIFPVPSAVRVTTPFTGGTGVDGAFNPTTNTVLDTTNGAFNFTSVDIPSNVTITATGSNPLEIYSTGSIKIAGKINISGGNGANGNNPGIGVAGGGDGGAGGDPNINGTPGLGQGGGHEGITSGWSGSSGGGFGTKGQDGCRSNKFAGGQAYGTPDLNPLVGGSGGGGGAGCFTSNARGGGGGAGGGAIRLQAAGTVEIKGEVVSDGGEGGVYGGTFSLPGSGGSGGAILVQGDTVLISGTLSARGNRGKDTGCGGGYSRDYDEAFNWQAAWGGDGRIRLEAVSGNIGGFVYSTKGKFACPDSPATNPLLTGIVSVANISGTYAGIIAQSKFYNSTIPSPIWKSAVITGTDLQQIAFEFQGADDDGNGTPDPATYSSWVDDLSKINSQQYVRFRLFFSVDNTTSSVDKVELPFD